MHADLAGEGGTGREMLFSSPGAELPDVYLSESVIFLNEAASDTYSIVLTHPPGMREDETVRVTAPRAMGGVN